MSKVSIDWESDPKSVLDAMKAIEARTSSSRGESRRWQEAPAIAQRAFERARRDNRGICKGRRVAAVSFSKAIDLANEGLKEQIDRFKEANELQKGKAAGHVKLANALRQCLRSSSSRSTGRSSGCARRRSTKARRTFSPRPFRRGRG